MGSHARLSPSSAERWMTCPASVQFSEGEPDSTSPYAAEGTVAHKILDTCGSNKTDPALYLNQVFIEDGFSITVDQPMVDAVKQAIAYVDVALLIQPDTQVFWERKVACGAMYGRDDSDGTADITLVSVAGRRLETIDFKYGVNPVAAEGNKQMGLYTLGSLFEFDPNIGQKGHAKYPFDAFVGTIIQPRVRSGSSLATSATQNAKEVMEMSNSYYHASLATDDPAAPFNPSEDACRYCPYGRNNKCTASVGKALKKANMVFSPIEDLGNSLSAEIQSNGVTNPRDLTEEQQIAVVENADFIITTVKGVVQYCTGRAVGGHQYAGLKVVEGVSKRAWASDVTTPALFKKLAGFGIKKVDAMAPSKVKSPKQILDLAKGLELSDKRRENLANLVIKPEGKKTLVPDSDPRKIAVKPIEFKPVQIEQTDSITNPMGDTPVKEIINE